MRLSPSQGLPPPAADRLRVLTYNIHKGVRGMGPGKRLEIHRLGDAIAALRADVVCLQEVRLFHQLDARRFARTHFGWPDEGQAEFLAPDGYHTVYRSNAVTRHGEHGNALLSRWPVGAVGHHDVSDHALEQRGLLHVPVRWPQTPTQTQAQAQAQAQAHLEVHVVVVHFGLIHSSRVRQVARLAEYLAQQVPPAAPLLVAGDFNDWGERLDAPMAAHGLQRALAAGGEWAQRSFPSRAPVFALDRVYSRGLRCVQALVPRGAAWSRMSDHLPLVVELCRP